MLLRKHSSPHDQLHTLLGNQAASNTPSGELPEAMTDDRINTSTRVQPGLHDGVLQGEEHAMEFHNILLRLCIKYLWKESCETTRAEYSIAMV